MKATRRDFLKLGATIAGVASTVSASSEETSSSAVSPAEAMPPAPKKGGMLYRSMGRTGAQISALGVGGHHLGDLLTADEAIRLVHEAIDGGITFFDEAKQQGKVRFVGFTAHKSPAIHLKMLAHNNPFGAVQLPLNCFDGTYRSFEHQVLPELERRSIAALGMKSLGGGGEPILHGVVTAEEALRYAMSLPSATTISGMESLDVLRQNLMIVRGFKPMPPEEMQALRERCKSFAADGHLELYKSTKKYDGGVGREQHGYPPSEQLPL